MFINPWLSKWNHFSILAAFTLNEENIGQRKYHCNCAMRFRTFVGKTCTIKTVLHFARFFFELNTFFRITFSEFKLQIVATLWQIGQSSIACFQATVDLLFNRDYFHLHKIIISCKINYDVCKMIYNLYLKILQHHLINVSNCHRKRHERRLEYWWVDQGFISFSNLLSDNRFLIFGGLRSYIWVPKDDKYKVVCISLRWKSELFLVL